MSLEIAIILLVVAIFSLQAQEGLSGQDISELRRRVSGLERKVRELEREKTT